MLIDGRRVTRWLSMEKRNAAFCDAKCRISSYCLPPFAWQKVVSWIQPKLVIRLYPYFVLLSGRLFFVFDEDVAGYIEIKRKAR